MNYTLGHQYSLAAVGLRKPISKTFMSRDAANQYMYEVLAKNNLTITSVWDDHHDKTYNCSNNVQFFIHRV